MVLSSPPWVVEPLGVSKVARIGTGNKFTTQARSDAPDPAADDAAAPTTRPRRGLRA